MQTRQQVCCVLPCEIIALIEPAAGHDKKGGHNSKIHSLVDKLCRRPWVLI
jgi:hypothetical protein